MHPRAADPIRLDEVTLGPVRVVGKAKPRADAPRIRAWESVQRKAAQPPRVLKSIRAAGDYDAGNVHRSNALWAASASDANRALRYGLATMRGRARDLERNDPYSKKFLELVETNIVGPEGISFQSRVNDYRPDGTIVPDNAANKIIEREWAAFGLPGNFDVTATLSRAAFERLFARTVARDGEVLVKRIGDKASRWGRRYQILESDWLDETYNEERPDGTRVVMGVELSAEGRAVAYWLRARHPGDALRAGNAERIRYGADQVKLYFLPTRPGQVRGVPWMHAAMSRLYQLGEFDESALIAARLGADKTMLLEDPEGMVKEMADGALPGEDGSTDMDDARSGALFFQSQKGSIDILPRGAKVANWDPNYPSDTYGPFVLAALRGVASGFGTSYESLSNDRAGVTWTSIRHAVLDERDHWKVLQSWMVSTLCHDLFADWLMVSLLSPAKPLNYLPAGKYDKFLSPSFTARRWDWVNPKDDIEAKVAAIKNRLTSHRRVLAEQGVDLEDLLLEIQQDRELAAQYNVDLDAAVSDQAPTAPVEPPDEPTPGALLTAALIKAMERPPQAQAAAPVTVNAPVTVTTPDVRVENHLPEQPAPTVHVENHLPEQPAPTVHVAAPAVDVHVEAAMPEQPAPVVNVTVETPDTLAITALPERLTTSTITRDAAGNITQSTQRERDA